MPEIELFKRIGSQFAVFPQYRMHDRQGTLGTSATVAQLTERVPHISELAPENIAVAL